MVLDDLGHRDPVITGCDAAGEAQQRSRKLRFRLFSSPVKCRPTLVSLSVLSAR
jgi:hypothetical protein